MARHKCPDTFWDYGWIYTRDIRKFLIRNSSNGRPPCKTIGDRRPIDTSEFMEFDFYQWVIYRDHPNFPEDPVKVGRWLGITHKIGNAMTYWVLTNKGTIIPRSTVRQLTKDE